MIPEPQTETLVAVLDDYDRCLNVRNKDDSITATSNSIVAHNRFQKDLHGPTVDVIGHGYTIINVKRQKSLEHRDLDYEDRPMVTVVSLKPIKELIIEATFEWCESFAWNGKHPHFEGPKVRP